LRSTAASSATSAVSSANSPSSHRPSSTPLQQRLLVAYCVDAGVTRRRARPLRLSPLVCTCGVGGGGLGGGASCSGRCRCVLRLQVLGPPRHTHTTRERAADGARSVLPMPCDSPWGALSADVLSPSQAN
jgi:hypothetical protein